MPVVVVESPAKAKTIGKYLGPDYKVFASYGHIRDLVAKDGSVDPDQDFKMIWELDSEGKKHIKPIADALKHDQHLILATDPDREGEAISWHLYDVLENKKTIKSTTQVERVVFHAITKNAILEAMKNPRPIDQALVQAYLARRALDYLVGYNLSPLLWRKLPGARSAGRVQSVALRLVVEREREIDAFTALEYWSVDAHLETPREAVLTAKLTHLEGKKLGKEDLGNEKAAQNARDVILASPIFVKSLETKPVNRNAAAPFMTSTLQQEASRKFRMGARQTMSIAQKLYEAGFITYMRTDGVTMAPEAIEAARSYIATKIGADYLPPKPNFYKNKVKNAQEAHECIRPTDMDRTPESASTLDPNQAKIYNLIWKRTIASQMSPARFESTVADLATQDQKACLRATGQVMRFDGFLKLYFEGRDDDVLNEEGILPSMQEGEILATQDVKTMQHFTQAPPRYTEASLIKRLEDLGIGRPSTYASIVSTIQERDYVGIDQQRMTPSDKGKLVTLFLESYFSRYVSYDFTANLENELDLVSVGEEKYDVLLRQFWEAFKTAVDENAQIRMTDVINKVNEVFGPAVFKDTDAEPNARLCPKCQIGELSIRLSKTGEMFIGCNHYPDCRYTRPIGANGTEESLPENTVIGTDNGVDIVLRTGRYGPYIQVGEGSDAKRASIPKPYQQGKIDLDLALRLLSLPRLVGEHPEDKKPVQTAFGPYGAYIRHNKAYANLTDHEQVFTIDIDQAVTLLAQKKSRPGRAAAEPMRHLGTHPDGGELAVYDGRFGPYVKWEKINATLPKTLDPMTVSLDQAIELVNAKPKKSTRKAPKKKPASK